jgi:hypothetical protein
VKILLLWFGLLAGSTLVAQDSIPKHRNVHLGVYSTLSYQVAMNGKAAKTDMGNFGFTGYLQPELGLGIRYQQDSTEFALVTLSVARLGFTLSSGNVIHDNGTDYPIYNRLDVMLNNYSLETSYHRRITKDKRNRYFSLECGAGIHIIQYYGVANSLDTAVGPYTISRTIDPGKELYALPSAQLGLNCFFRSSEHKTEYLIGIRSQLYLAKFSQLNYSVQYTSPNTTLYYYFRWSPVILTPKIYVMAVF